MSGIFIIVIITWTISFTSLKQCNECIQYIFPVIFHNSLLCNELLQTVVKIKDVALVTEHEIKDCVYWTYICIYCGCKDTYGYITEDHYCVS